MDGQENLETEDPYAFVRKWLADIRKRSQSQDGAFGIFAKAGELDSMIVKHPELIEQAQHATASLATRLQMFEQSSIIKPLSHRVSVSLEPDFLYFMETPLCYLKSLRFGFVNVLFEKLGIKVAQDRDGSRIHFSFKNNKISIHLHDKHKGELDGGRISSLRKFLIDCRFMIDETQNLVTQKPVRGRR